MVEEIVPQNALEALKNGAILLDVRESEELIIAKVDPHIHISMNEIANRYTELPKNKTILCLCRTGGRSGKVAEFLLSKGFLAKNITGGIHKWSEDIDNTLVQY